MKYFMTLLSFSLLLSAGDFKTFNVEKRYQQIDKEFTEPCNCGEPAKLYPYRGEDIPFAKTMPCPLNGCAN